jgi:ComEC/Rec2-related protein
MLPWLPFIALGLVVGACAPGSLAWWWGCGAPLAVLAIGLCRIWPVAARWLVFAAAALLGGVLGRSGDPPPGAVSRLIEVSGTVTTVAWQGYGQGFALVDVTAEMPADWVPPRRIFVRAPPVPGVRPGDRATVRGVWQRDARGEAVRAVELEVQSRTTGPRGFAWRVIDRIDGHDELAATLLLGRGDPPERTTFRSAGLAHILAVSGMHLAIAAGLGWWLLRAAGFGWGARLAALGILVVGYTWLTHGNPATLRACAMAVAVLLCHALRREPHRLGPVSLAALGLVIWDPGMAREIGFQLSLAAVLGIVTLGMDLIHLRERTVPLRPWPLDRPSWRVLLWVARSLADAAVIGLAATLATAPLIAWHFGQLAPWAWVTSLAAGIPATVALWAGLPLLLCAGGWPDGPWEGLYRLVEWSLDALSACATWGAQHLPQQQAIAPPPVVLCAWPLLFVRLRDGWDLLIRIVAAVALSACWYLG